MTTEFERTMEHDVDRIMRKIASGQSLTLPEAKRAKNYLNSKRPYIEGLLVKSELTPKEKMEVSRYNTHIEILRRTMPGVGAKAALCQDDPDLGGWRYAPEGNPGKGKTVSSELMEQRIEELLTQLGGSEPLAVYKLDQVEDYLKAKDAEIKEAKKLREDFNAKLRVVQKASAHQHPDTAERSSKIAKSFVRVKKLVVRKKP
jgi:hypothetical protein